MGIASTVKGWLSRPLTYLGGEWNRMAPRERRLVTGAGGAVAAAALLLVGFLTVDTLAENETANESMRVALQTIGKKKGEYLDARARMVAQEVRIGSEAPQLGAIWTPRHARPASRSPRPATCRPSPPGDATSSTAST
jgi:type II secretory pathway component PulM